MLKAIVTLLSPSQWIFLGVAVISMITGIVLLHNRVYDSGVQAERTRIERQQNEARQRAINAARTVRACYDAGGLWEQATGRCIMPSDPSSNTDGSRQ